MGSCCSSVKGTNLNTATAKRRLACITMGRKVPDGHKYPEWRKEEAMMTGATPTKAEKKKGITKLSMDIAASSLAGTSLPDSYKIPQDDFALHVFDGKGAVAAVLDGHGNSGRRVVACTKHILARRFRSAKRLGNAGMTARKALGRAHFSSRWSPGIDARVSGCAAIVCVLSGHKVTCANIGNCRAVVGYKNNQSKIKCLDISVDHVWGSGKERPKSFFKGRLSQCKNSQGEKIGPVRLWKRGGAEMPGLALSRSIGDTMAHRRGVSKQPQVLTHTVTSKDECIVLASSGVWQVLDSMEAIQMALSQKTSADAADFLCRESAKRWSEEEGEYDDITAVVILLKHGEEE